MLAKEIGLWRRPSPLQPCQRRRHVHVPCDGSARADERADADEFDVHWPAARTAAFSRPSQEPRSHVRPHLPLPGPPAPRGLSGKRPHLSSRGLDGARGVDRSTFHLSPTPPKDRSTHFQGPGLSSHRLGPSRHGALTIDSTVDIIGLSSRHHGVYRPKRHRFRSARGHHPRRWAADEVDPEAVQTPGGRSGQK